MLRQSRYSPWVRHLHWLIFVLVAGALALIYLQDLAPKGSELRANLKWAHVQFGIAALLVMLPRLLVRLRHHGDEPPITPSPPRWQVRMSRLIHVTLYALLFAVPLLGVSMMLAKGTPWDFAGVALPVLPAPDRSLAHAIAEVHETLGNVLMYLAGFHAAAALFHHVFQRDDTLRRMLPARRTALRAAHAGD